MSGEPSASEAMKGILLHSDISKDVTYIAKLLYDNNANAVIVRDSGMPVGIITAADFIKAIAATNKDPRKITAQEIMTKPIISINHDEDISRARELMVANGIREVPVKKDFDIVGLIVQEDLIRNSSWLNRG